MSALDVLALLAGIGLVAVTFYDLFESVLLPRPAIGRLRIANTTILWTWRLWRRLGTRFESISARENALSLFAPAMAVGLLAIWALAMVVGFGLILWAGRHNIRPEPSNLGDSFYLSALSLFTLGFGDVVPVSAATRIVTLLEAATGLGLIALVISLLFSLFSSVQRREALVVATDATAGAPPSGVQLLETCARYSMPDELIKTFQDWRVWAAEVLESHLAYPILSYFRSSHDGEAWLNSFGAVMDAAVLAMTTVETPAAGSARIMWKVGYHLVEDVSWFFRIPHEHVPGVSLEEFQEARERLRFAGYELKPEEQSWEEFQQLRSRYAEPLVRMAAFLAIEPTQWIGDRMFMFHRERAQRAAAGHQSTGA
ncbi:MAG TPA: ion channel [Candidatus Dormibacteraeota bacterium]